MLTILYDTLYDFPPSNTEFCIMYELPFVTPFEIKAPYPPEPSLTAVGVTPSPELPTLHPVISPVAKSPFVISSLPVSVKFGLSTRLIPAALKSPFVTSSLPNAWVLIALLSPNDHPIPFVQSSPTSLTDTLSITKTPVLDKALSTKVFPLPDV